MNFPPNCYLTADVLLLVSGEILLIRRGRDPHRGSWAFPGGFVDEGETVLAAAQRELEEETGVTGMTLQQFATYADPGRDPRGRTVSIVHWARLERKPESKAGDDAAETGWYPLEQLPQQMAFDHAKIARDFLAYLKKIGLK
jgi:8-oxo-dGTP diphosphatase